MFRPLLAFVLCLFVQTANAETRAPIYNDTLDLMLADIQVLPNVASARIDREDQSLKIVLTDGQEVTSNPDNLHQMLQGTTDPAERNALIAQFTQTIAELSDPKPTLDAASLTVNVLPVIRSDDYLTTNSNPDAPPDQKLQQKFLPGLSIFYVFDTPNSVQFLQAEDVTKAGFDLATVDAAAKARIAEYGGTFRTEPISNLTMVVLDGFYETSLLLVPEIWNAVDQDIDRLVIGIPARDVLLYGDAANPDVIEELKATIARISAEGAYPLSDRLLEWKAGSWHYFD